jgi:hypothetical protein
MSKIAQGYHPWDGSAINASATDTSAIDGSAPQTLA